MNSSDLRGGVSARVRCCWQRLTGGEAMGDEEGKDRSELRWARGRLKPMLIQIKRYGGTGALQREK
jgi:hypothetical protein